MGSYSFNPFLEAAKAIGASLVRTIVPGIVGWAVTQLVLLGLTVDAQFESALTSGLTVGFATLWYLIVRVLEVYVAPRFGWLLGLAKAPQYIKGPPKDATANSAPKHAL